MSLHSESRVVELESRNMELQAKVAKLEAEVKTLKFLNACLEEDIEDLENELEDGP